MKKKIRKNIYPKVKNLDLNLFKLTDSTKKKIENFITDYQKKREKQKIDKEKRIKAERKKEILKEQRLLKKEKLQKLKEEKFQILQQKKLITDN